jgi:aspartate kinase
MSVHIFKFGGASIKDADSVNRMKEIVQKQLNSSHGRLIIVVSAMGKTTNKLESLLENWINSNKEEVSKVFNSCIQDHLEIIRDLALEKCKEFNSYSEDLKKYLQNEPSGGFDFHYDQIVSFGELFSSSIICAYLNATGVHVDWKDSRSMIRTSDVYRSAEVKWKTSMNEISQQLGDKPKTIITQGFLGGANKGTTTLGREGSDYSAAIFACALQAKEVVFWKDVPGVMNMDPRLSDNAHLYKSLPYKEAAEMTYYGAQIIHPKTIKPLENHGIELIVKPFMSPDQKGTIIGEKPIKPALPSFIYKKNLCLISFKLPDFEFVNQMHLTAIFDALSRLNINIYMMQNSAISISVVLYCS